MSQCMQRIVELELMPETLVTMETFFFFFSCLLDSDEVEQHKREKNMENSIESQGKNSF